MHLSPSVALASVHSKAGVLLLFEFMLIVTPIVGICNYSMFCCAFYVHSSFAIILMGTRELIALLCLSSWCLVIVVWLNLTMPLVCLQFVIVVVPDHTHLLFLSITNDIVSTKIYDKRDDFNFEIVNYPFLDGDLARSPSFLVLQSSEVIALLLLSYGCL